MALRQVLQRAGKGQLVSCSTLMRAQALQRPLGLGAAVSQHRGSSMLVAARSFSSDQHSFYYDLLVKRLDGLESRLDGKLTREFSRLDNDNNKLLELQYSKQWIYDAWGTAGMVCIGVCVVCGVVTISAVMADRSRASTQDQREQQPTKATTATE